MSRSAATSRTTTRPALRHAYPALPDGNTLFPFRRLFLLAVGR